MVRNVVAGYADINESGKKDIGEGGRHADFCVIVDCKDRIEFGSVQTN